jgi:hypothetical protein
VAAFLMWTAEPKMMARKQAGFVGVMFLTILSVLLYLVNKRLWAPVKMRKQVVVLKDDGDRAVAGRHPVDLHIIPEHAPLRRGEEPGDNVEKRGLPRAGGSEDGADRTPGNREIGIEAKISLGDAESLKGEHRRDLPGRRSRRARG